MIYIHNYIENNLKLYKFFNKFFFNISNRKLHYDFIIFFAFISIFLLSIYVKFFKTVDRFILEFFGPGLVGRIFSNLSKLINFQQNANITIYIISLINYTFLIGIMLVTYN